MIVATLLALAFGAQDAGDVRAFWESHPWAVTKATRDCTGATYVEDHDHWFMIYAIPTVGGISVAYEDKRLTTKEGQDYQVRIKLHQGKQVVDATWPSGTAMASVRGKSMGLMFKVIGFDALDDLAQSDAITFVVQGRPVRTLRLSGSAQMVRALKRCMSELKQ